MMGIVIVFIHSLYSTQAANEAVSVAAMICHHWHLPVIGDDDCIISSFVGSASEYSSYALSCSIGYAIEQHAVHLFLLL